MDSFSVLLLFTFAVTRVLCVQDVRCIRADRSWSGLFNTNNPANTVCYIEKFPLTDPRIEEFHFLVDYKLPGDINWVEFGVQNVVKYIPKDIFTVFPNIRTFIMTTRISELFPGDFDHANILEELRLSNNHIKIIRNGVFSVSLLNNDEMLPLKLLKYLFLDNNEIYEIEENSFEGLTSLSGLALTRNKLRVINERTFAGLVNLHTLALDENYIEIIEAGALNFRGLTNLILRSNRLTQLPDGIFYRLSSLEYLHLDHNKLNRLSDNLLYGLSRLSHIMLQYNDLEHIGQSLYRSPYLYDIVLRGNRIKDIDLIAFAHMPGTLDLDLADSGFTIATVDIKTEELWDSSLWKLDISKNNLFDAMELNKLRMFPKLSYLIVDKNPLKDLEIGSDRTLKDVIPSLQTLQAIETDMSCEYLLAISQKYKSVNVHIINSTFKIGWQPLYC